MNLAALPAGCGAFSTRRPCRFRNRRIERFLWRSVRVYRLIAEFIVRIADLAEAEGRLLRRAVARLGMGLSLIVVASALVLLGAGLLLAGAWIAIGQQIGPAWASAITGGMALVLAGAALFTSVRLGR